MTSGDLAYRALELRTLSPAITANQTVVVTYTDPGTGDDTTAVLQDAAGNDVATFTTGEGGVPAVVNNVPVPWSVTVDPAAINEFGGVVSSTLTVSTGGATFPVDQTIVLELSGTAAGGDFEIFDANGVRIPPGGSATRSLDAGESELSFTITALADEVDDPDETLVIQAKHGAGTAVDPQVDIGEAVTVTIRNVPFPWSVTAEPATIAEDDGVAVVTVSTGGATLGTARTIALELDGTATEDVDYEIDSKSLLLEAGGTVATTTIRAVSDTDIEGAETVTIAAMIDTEQIGETVTVTIVEIEPPGAPNLSAVLACTGCVDVLWKAPDSEGGGPITGYQYQRKEGDGAYGQWTDLEAGTLVDYDVDPNTTYTYRVRAVNAGGGGAASNERSATTGPPIEVGADPLEYRVAETAGSVKVKVVAKVPEELGPIRARVRGHRRDRIEIGYVIRGLQTDYGELDVRPLRHHEHRRAVHRDQGRVDRDRGQARGGGRGVLRGSRGARARSGLLHPDPRRDRHRDGDDRGRRPRAGDPAAAVERGAGPDRGGPVAGERRGRRRTGVAHRRRRRPRPIRSDRRRAAEHQDGSHERDACEPGRR